MHSAPRRVAVVGFGRFGQLLASILSEDFRVIIYDADENKRNIAESQGFTTTGFELACRAETIFLCVPISAIDQVSRNMADKLEGGLVIDTCSVKIHPLRSLSANLPSGTEVLGSHPLFGPDSAGNLEDRKMIFCPQTVGRNALKFWQTYWRGKGLDVIQMTAEEHDRQAAYSQGIAHFLGRVLDELRLYPQPVTTKGYLDLLDLISQTTNDTQQLFDDLQHFNPYTKDMRNDLSRALLEAKNRLDNLVRD